MKKTIVTHVEVMDREGSNFGKMIVTLENGKKFELPLSRAGKYQFQVFDLYANCIPTVESVQNAINYVGWSSDFLAGK